MSLRKITTAERVNKDRRITVRQTPTDESWRVVHDGKRVLHIFHSGGATMTCNNIICGDARDICVEMKKLKLEYDEDMIKEVLEGGKDRDVMEELTNKPIEEEPIREASR